MHVIISSHADERIAQRLAPLIPDAAAHEWVSREVVGGRLASRSPRWHGRMRVADAARRFVRTRVGSRGVLIVVERVAREIVRVVTVIVEGAIAPLPRRKRLTDPQIGRPSRRPLPPATARLGVRAAV